MITAKRLYLVLIILLVVTVSGGVYSVWYANNWLTGQSQALVEKKLELISLNEKQQRAFESRNTLNKYSDLHGTVEAVAPTEKEQEKIIAELYKIAEENDLRISTLSFPSSELGEEKKKSETKTAPAADSKTATPPATPTTPAAPAAPTNTITQTEKVDGLTGVVGLKITPSNITQNGYGSGMSYETLLAFLEALERNRRQMIIDEISIIPTDDTVNGANVYQLSLSLTALIAQ